MTKVVQAERVSAVVGSTVVVGVLTCCALLPCIASKFSPP